MARQRSPQSKRYTRRGSLKLGLTLAAASVVGTSATRDALAQGSPVASPVVDDGYPRPELLVDTDWVVANGSDPSVVLVAFMPPDDFETGHIPGSVQIDWPELEVIDTSDASIERWRQDVAQLVGTLGITRESTVITYDADTLFAARLWWVLHYLGHEDVRVLNGGLAAWQEAGNAIEDGAAGDVSGDAVPYQPSPNTGALAQMDEVLERLDDPDVAIIDARTPGEYADGHIPGAVNVNYPLNALSDPPRYWKPASELRAMYEEQGVTPDKRVIPYCASGVRSAVTAFTLHLIGYADVGLYTGSWQEWGEDPDAPKATGDQP